jgi:hypothetical protein
LLAEFSRIRTEVQSLFSSFSGSGALPCPSPVTVLGHSFSVCAETYADKLAGIGAAIVLTASLISAFIIFRR